MHIKQELHHNLFLIMVAAAVVGFTGKAHTVEKRNVKQEMKEAGNDIRRGTTKAGRKITDETCEYINGKMECAAKRTENKVKNASDEVEDSVEN